MAGSQNSGTENGVTTPNRKRTTRNRARSRSIRPGAGTGIGSGVTSGVGSGPVAIDLFGAQMRGYVEGFAAAHGLQPQQLLNGAKKHLTW